MLPDQAAVWIQSYSKIRLSHEREQPPAQEPVSELGHDEDSAPLLAGLPCDIAQGLDLEQVQRSGDFPFHAIVASRSPVLWPQRLSFGILHLGTAIARLIGLNRVAAAPRTGRDGPLPNGRWSVGGSPDPPTCLNRARFFRSHSARWSGLIRAAGIFERHDHQYQTDGQEDQQANRE